MDCLIGEIKFIVINGCIFYEVNAELIKFSPEISGQLILPILNLKIKQLETTAKPLVENIAV